MDVMKNDMMPIDKKHIDGIYILFHFEITLMEEQYQGK